MQTLTAGSPAPNFTLHNQNGEAVTLSDYRGQKVLVYFYPKAMTPGCTVQAQQLRDHFQAFQDKHVVVMGISIDAVTRLKKFAERDDLPFILLADEDHTVAEQFGVWGEKKFMGKVYDGIHRISFLINEEGVIETVFDKFKTKDHHEVVLAALD